ncbi:MAG TPA: hypothetical protein VGC15_20235 [Acetobacteraceae bacterium]
MHLNIQGGALAEFLEQPLGFLKRGDQHLAAQRDVFGHQGSSILHLDPHGIAAVFGQPGFWPFHGKNTPFAPVMHEADSDLVVEQENAVQPT